MEPLVEPGVAVGAGAGVDVAVELFTVKLAWSAASCA
jgi:hypothetical protein